MCVHNLYLLSSIVRGAWFIEPNYVKSIAPVMNKILAGDEITIGDKPQSKFPAFTATLHNSNTALIEFSEMPDTVQKDTVAIIPLCGPIMKYDYCWEPGTQTRAKQLEQIDANDNYRAAILWIDSPGGEAMATEILYNAVQNFSKPIFAYVNGLCASAAYWVACGCDKIYASTDTSLIGSIGTMFTLVDAQAMLEREGIKIHEVFATKSTDKNKMFNDVLENNYETIRKELLDPLNTIFMDAVTSNRKKLNAEETLTGKTFFTQDAIVMGLIDDREDFNVVITKITNMFGLTNKFKKLDRFANKEKLTAAEKSEVKKILSAAGINFEDSEPAATTKPEGVVKSLLYEATEGKNIFVYAEVGEDPTGRRCVYADEAGNATEENVVDGPHACKDGSTLETETREDAMSYVKLWTPAGTAVPAPETIPAPAVQPASTATASAQTPLTLEAIGSLFNTQLEGVKKEILTAVDEKIDGVKNELVAGKTPNRGVNGSGVSQDTRVYSESAFEKRRKEIREKNQNQN